ncbi:hypothetical protein IA69_11560 [Massilia sp. JS1662]|nr:SPOR domain-containing protein [Massilia sp. JS1662]KGF81582.1 hypothetical protein IA69_11560 [Massilia sp. JS1662]
MGLFSRKNKQDRLAEDSGRFYSKDDDAALGERARAKRATNAGGGATRRPGADPMLPEKKRARRRLVGAIALALAAAVGLPMLLDSEPKPLAGDIAIQIPAKDKAAPLPVPAADKAVSAADSVDKDEEVIDAPPPAKAPAAVAAAKPESVATQPPAVIAPKPEPKVEHKPEHKEVPKPEHKDAKAEARLAEKERAEREKAEHDRAEREKAERLAREAREKAKKAEEKPVKPKDDAARAIAILEGKPAEKEKPAESSSQRFVLQVAALSSQEKAAEVQAKLREAGISSYTQKTSTPNGELIRVRVGPLNKEDAEKVRAKLGRLGMSGAMTPV